jgi:hypothetical protein
LIACGCTAFLVPRAEAKQVAPFRTALAVRWGQAAGSDAFRDDLARTLAENLAGRCFAGVAIVDRDPSPGDAELVFSVILSGSSADPLRIYRDHPAARRPAKELRPSRTSGHVTRDPVHAWGKRALVGLNLVRSTHRLTIPGEDAQAAFRLEVIDNIVGDLARALGCGGAKLERKIRDALGAAGEASPAPR